jgi:hypothetical protein
VPVLNSTTNLPRRLGSIRGGIKRAARVRAWDESVKGGRDISDWAAGRVGARWVGSVSMGRDAADSWCFASAWLVVGDLTGEVVAQSVFIVGKEHLDCHSHAPSMGAGASCCL